MKLYSMKRNLLVSCIGFLFVITCVRSQTGTTSLHGVVTDKTGAAIVGASVTLSIPSSGLHREANTGAGGEYDFLSLPPGTYALAVEMTNFRKYEQTNLQLLGNPPPPGNVRFAVGTAVQPVEASAQT